MDTRKSWRPGALAAVALVATTTRAWAQAGNGIFTQFGNAGTELASNAPVVIGAVTLPLGGWLLGNGGWNLYKHFSPRHRADGAMASAAASTVAGAIILGLVAWAALGTATFTGGAPTAGSGAAVTFQ